jgi:hypothetical protein
MVEGRRKGEEIEIKCPCCGASLKVDTRLGGVLSWEAPAKRTEPRDLSQAGRVLEQERSRREALFRKSAEEEKIKSRLLDRKFEEAMKKSRDEPVTPPTRDIDLD